LVPDTFTQEKYSLYLKYQTLIHKESKHETTPEQFTRFLCSSPLQHKPWTDETTLQTRQTGTFHQLYRLDGELVAFAVLDMLPNTISSVYFVYDPEKLGRFGMGKVSAVREVAMCIEGGYKYYGLGKPPPFSICVGDEGVGWTDDRVVCGGV
jgi:arginyl-tRNA---protein transferase